MKTTPGNLWGDQYPFERNVAQRTMTMLGLAGLFVVTTILLVRTEPARECCPGSLRCPGTATCRRPA